ncbi:Diguanylate-cyclase [Chitinivibrio alkaliphilus ACht1]|uniref:diguanylate cyclase n=2 Tax=Chitinivibrio TaxID=1505231 RepID=U7D6G0_9BACT|nr:Diguanylate-cyclase [Chitinivibrio alkaliphilus ACht1]
MIELQCSLIEAQKLLQHQATHDPLTGILNRRAIMEALSKEWARFTRTKNNFTLGFVDIDHFKKINDLFGHSIGDDTLKEICESFTSSLREYDVFGRYGGEEFLIISPQTTLPDHLSIYERKREEIAKKSIHKENRTHPLSVSIGVASSHEASSLDELVSLADTRLYAAKESGRNAVVYT